MAYSDWRDKTSSFKKIDVRGAEVSRDIPDNSVAVGVPARVVKAIERDCE